MTLVVDASVAIKWVVAENDTDAARALFDLPDPLIAPDWLLIEAASTFWKKVKRSELFELHASDHLRELPNYFGRLFASSPLIDTALNLSFRLRHPVYDCLYLALAQRQFCQVVTADKKFFAAASAAGFEKDIRLLGQPEK